MVSARPGSGWGAALGGAARHDTRRAGHTGQDTLCESVPGLRAWIQWLDAGLRHRQDRGGRCGRAPAGNRPGRPDRRSLCLIPFTPADRYMDQIELKILSLLQKDATRPVAEIAEQAK